MNRKVTVYSTMGKKNTSFVCEGNTFNDLKKVMRGLDIKHNGMKAVVGETRVTLESANAIIPDTDFTLFLMPIKTKSGASVRKEIMLKIKELRVKNPDAVKKHFTYQGRNVTQISTDKLEELFASYSGNDTSIGTSKSVESAKSAAKKSVEKIKETKKSAVTPRGNVVTLDVFNEFKVILISKLEVVEKTNEKAKASVAEAIAFLNTDIKSVADAIKELSNENEKLGIEAHDIASDFNDIQQF